MIQKLHEIVRLTYTEHPAQGTALRRIREHVSSLILKIKESEDQAIIETSNEPLELLRSIL